MSQAIDWSVPLSGPVPPDEMADRMDKSFDALLSAHSGATRPAYAVAGTLWLSTAVAGQHKYYFFDGVSDRLFVTIDTTTGMLTWPGGKVAADIDLNAFNLNNVAKLNGSPLGGVRNKIINGDGLVSQRNATFTITAGNSAYTLDRLLVKNNTNQTVTVSQQPMTPGQVLVPGNPRYKTRFAFSSAPTSGTLRAEQRIEDVFTFAGQNASMRSYFTGPTGSETLACEVVQNFGTGGSPSSAVTTAAASLDVATIYNASTQLRRAQFVVPGVSSKVLGSNNNDYISVAWTLTPRQTGNYEMARYSAVEGDAFYETDPFSPRHVQQELALCQRYLFIGFLPLRGVVLSGPTNAARLGASLPVAMRAAPTVGVTGTVFDGSANATITATPSNTSGPTAIEIDATVTAGLTAFRPAILVGPYGTSVIQADAEL